MGKMTYDLEVEGPHHNFVANGVVTHNSVNEYSTRYSIAIDAAQTTPPDQWRLQSGGNRQGSAGLIESDVGEALSREELALHRETRRVYEARLERGRARRGAQSPPHRAKPTGRSTAHHPACRCACGRPLRRNSPVRA
jgi:hypothetical protein